MNITESILNEIDWNTGFAIPVANVDNRKLESEVVACAEDLERNKKELEYTDDRVHAMTAHLANVKQELQNCQALYMAKGNEYQSEEHVSKIVDRELGRLRLEIIRINQQIAETHDKEASQESQTLALNREFDSLKNFAQVDQKSLEAWLEESARLDENMLVVGRYMQQDEEKIKDLTLEVERLTRERDKRHKQLNQETTETQMAQVELDRISEEFRRTHQERQELIKQWEHTVQRMQQRDREMEELALELQGLKETMDGKSVALREKRRLLDSHVATNQETETKIGAAERAAGKVKGEAQEADRQRDILQSELEALKRITDRTATDLEAARARLNQLKQQIYRMSDTYERTKIENKEMAKRLEEAKSELMTAEESVNRLEEMQREQERQQQQMEVELKHLRDTEFRKVQAVAEMTDRDKTLIATIQGSQATLKNLSSRIRQLDNDVLKQQSILYHQDFALGRLESRLSRMQGETSSDEKATLIAKISDLTQTLEQKEEIHSTVTAELSHLSEELRRTQRATELTIQEQQKLSDKIAELELYDDTTAKLRKKLLMTKQDDMVEENLLKLEIKRLKSLLLSKSSDVTTLQRRQMELEQMMKERMKEIAVHDQMLDTQVKQSDAERQQIATELAERNAKIERLKKRFDIISVMMAPPAGEEEHSQAYYVIKAAQDREEYQRRGDKLDADIRKTERELRALENTIRLMNDRNDKYKKSFAKITDNSEESIEKEALEAQLGVAMEKLRIKRQRLDEVEGDLKMMRITMETLQREESAQIELVQDRQTRLAALEKDLADQREKLDRVMRQIGRYQREIRQAKGASPKDKIPEELDIDLRHRRDYNKLVINSIQEAIVATPEMGPIVSMHFHEANLPPPAEATLGGSDTASSRGSSRTGSIAGGPSASVRGSIASPAVLHAAPVLIGADVFPQGQQQGGSGRLSVASSGSGRSKTSSRGVPSPKH